MKNVINKLKHNFKMFLLKTGFFGKNLYYSQYGQDFYILKHFKFKKDGFFIDIGAYNGISISNTKKMEDLGWYGICIEPNPEIYKILCTKRKCKKYNIAIAEDNGKRCFTQVEGYCAVLSGIKENMSEKQIKRVEEEARQANCAIKTIEVETKTFDALMADFKDIQTIDYISIDTEGNEFKILKSIDFSKYDIKTLSVENNYQKPEIKEFMRNAGYTCVANLGCDEIYIKN